MSRMYILASTELKKFGFMTDTAPLSIFNLDFFQAIWKKSKNLLRHFHVLKEYSVITV